MKSKIIKVIIVMLMMLCVSIPSLADTLTLDIKANKEKLTVGENIKITVLWDKGMQAADFSLLYDSEIVEFVKSDISEVFINSKENEVKVAWFSLENEDKTEIEFIFKVKKIGNVEFSTKINGGFATGELELFEDYNNAKLNIESEKSLMPIFIVGIIIVLVILFIIRKSRAKKRGTKNKNVVKK